MCFCYVGNRGLGSKHLKKMPQQHVVFLAHLPMLQLNSSAKKSSLVVKKQQLGTKSIENQWKLVPKRSHVVANDKTPLPAKLIRDVPVWEIAMLP